jgi:hypothetical protein
VAKPRRRSSDSSVDLPPPEQPEIVTKFSMGVAIIFEMLQRTLLQVGCSQLNVSCGSAEDCSASRSYQYRLAATHAQLRRRVGSGGAGRITRPSASASIAGILKNRIS